MKYWSVIKAFFVLEILQNILRFGIDIRNGADISVVDWGSEATLAVGGAFVFVLALRAMVLGYILFHLIKILGGKKR